VGLCHVTGMAQVAVVVKGVIWGTAVAIEVVAGVGGVGFVVGDIALCCGHVVGVCHVIHIVQHIWVSQGFAFIVVGALGYVPLVCVAIETFLYIVGTVYDIFTSAIG
jgi:hypothetical protein